MKAGITVQELIAEIEQQQETKIDYVAGTRGLEFAYDREGLPNLVMNSGDAFVLTDHAQGQIAGHVGIPIKYYEMMQRKAPDLLATNVNHWLRHRPKEEKRLIRTLNGNARAFLSDRYRPMDNSDLARAVLPALANSGAKVHSCNISETRMYLKAVVPDRQIEFTPVTFNPAIVISNSEVGAGALAIQLAVHTLPCTNMAVWARPALGKYGMNNQLRKHHVGPALSLGLGVDSDESEWPSMLGGTKQPDDSELWAQVEDMVQGAIEGDMFDTLVQELRSARESTITTSQAGRALERLANLKSLTKDESTPILEYLMDEGDLSKFGLSNAITRYSQDVDDYARASFFERLGGEVIAFSQSKWRSLLN